MRNKKGQEELAVLLMVIVVAFFVVFFITSMVNSVVSESISLNDLDEVCKVLTNESDAFYYEETGWQKRMTCRVGNEIQIFYEGV